MQKHLRYFRGLGQINTKHCDLISINYLTIIFKRNVAMDNIEYEYVQNMAGNHLLTQNEKYKKTTIPVKRNMTELKM